MLGDDEEEMVILQFNQLERITLIKTVSGLPSASPQRRAFISPKRKRE